MELDNNNNSDMLYEELVSFISKLEKLRLINKLSVYVYTSFIYHDQLADTINFYNRMKIVTKELVSKYNFNIFDFPRGKRTGNCKFNDLNSFVFDNNGEIYKCHQHIGLDSKIIDNLKNDFKLSEKYKIYMDDCIKTDCYMYPYCNESCNCFVENNQSICFRQENHLDYVFDCITLLNKGE